MMTIQLRKKSMFAVVAICAFFASSYSVQAEEGLLYWPVTPCRIVDTRNADVPGRILAGQPKQYHVFGSGGNANRIAAQGGNLEGCPSPKEKPLAVHINLISANQTGNGNLVVYPAGEAIPNATLINYKQGVNISNAAIVKTCQSCSPESNIAVASGNAGTHVIMDVMGYYFAAPSGAGTILPTIEEIDGGKRIIDSWVSSGGRNRFSFRNHHFLFDIIQGGNVEINIESSINDYLYLVNSLGFIVTETSSDTINEDLSPGTYTVIAATLSSGEKSNYTLAVQGAIDNIRKIDSQRIEQIENWTSSGGRVKNSFRNDHYLFDVPLDSHLDITIESSVTNYLYLINSLGFIVAETSGNRLVSTILADSYRLVAATLSVGQSSNYVLTVVGQFNNFVEKSSNVIETIGSWDSSGGRNRNSVNNPSYSFSVTEESLVDVTIVSSVSNYLYLVDSLDNVVFETSGDRLRAFVPPGEYKLVAATVSTGQASNFVLTVYGQINNFSQN